MPPKNEGSSQKRPSDDLGAISPAGGVAMSPRSKRRRHRSMADLELSAVATNNDAELEDCSCPVCMEPVACAAKADCGHPLCWTCAHQLCRDADSERPATCPMCRAVIREQVDPAGAIGTLGRCEATDKLAQRQAARTMKGEALRSWRERVAEGDAIVTRIEQDRNAGLPYRVTAGDGYASLEVAFVASIAPTGRAQCKVCGEAIKAKTICLNATACASGSAAGADAAAASGSCGFEHLGCKDFASLLQQCKAARKSVPGAKAGTGEVRLTVTSDLDERAAEMLERAEERVRIAEARQNFYEQRLRAQQEERQAAAQQRSSDTTSATATAAAAAAAAPTEQEAGTTVAAVAATEAELAAGDTAFAASGIFASIFDQDALFPDAAAESGTTTAESAQESGPHSAAAAAKLIRDYSGSAAQAVDQALLQQEEQLKRRLQEATAELPWWCIAKHTGNIWDTDQSADDGLGDFGGGGDLSVEELDATTQQVYAARTMAHAILRQVCTRHRLACHVHHTPSPLPASPPRLPSSVRAAEVTLTPLS
eukprot:COSAG05_NODE_667_length_8005_cov_4.987984_7_plen_540_part_00